MRSPAALFLVLLTTGSAVAQRAPLDDMTALIEGLAQGKRSPNDLRVRVEWLRGNTLVTAEVYGRGVGIWNGKAQFGLAKDDVPAVVEGLKKARFGSLGESYGDDQGDRLKMRGKVTVDVGPASKTVVQLLTGSQSDELAALAARVLAVTEKPARAGISASDLSDGLGKVAAGRLAPEALHIVAQRREDRPDAKEGWLARLDGRELTVQRFSGPEGFGPPRRLTVSDEELRRLAAALRETDLATLPRNPYASEYTDLRVDVLNRSVDLQARRYMGVTAETHGAAQDRFDRAIGEILRLVERVP